MLKITKIGQCFTELFNKKQGFPQLWITVYLQYIFGYWQQKQRDALKTCTAGAGVEDYNDNADVKPLTKTVCDNVCMRLTIVLVKLTYIVSRLNRLVTGSS